MTETSKPKIGLALGGGSARGWAHIGVIRSLNEAGIKPDIVCGTSIGALVGAAYAAGELDRLEQWTNGLTWQNVVGFLDLSLNGGLIKGAKLMDFFRRTFVDLEIQQLSLPFAAVATELGSGHEIWLRDGKVSDAVRASIALPGLFRPVEREGRLLVDGGLVNPVPVSLCRAMGADIVIAVDLNADLVGRYLQKNTTEKNGSPGKPERFGESLLNQIRARVVSLGATVDGVKYFPSLLEVLASGINIMQVRITRSRLAGEPADVLITPRLGSMGLMEFHLAAVAIAAGRRAAGHVLHQIHDLMHDAL